MSPPMIFAVQSVCGYLAWLLCFGVYVLPRLKSMDPVEAQRVIATLHSFRFFGLVVLLPGIVDPNLPLRLTSVAGYWDLATGVLAIITLMTVRIRPIFWLFVAAFNLVGVADLILTYYYAVKVNLPALAGQMGAAYVIPILYAPVLMISHVAAIYLFMRPQPKAARSIASHATVS
jgi:hypothetical protein